MPGSIGASLDTVGIGSIGTPEPSCRMFWELQHVCLHDIVHRLEMSVGGGDRDAGMDGNVGEPLWLGACRRDVAADRFDESLACVAAVASCRGGASRKLIEPHAKHRTN
ncbi:MAG: hypothetical protein M3337_03280 [Actinomycetota bacterium]|nr:hypothetical protein [Actinomycetota bacterium]